MANSNTRRTSDYVAVFQHRLRTQIAIVLSLIFSIVTAGTLGYHFIEKMSFLDSLYMTVITLSTVGFGEIKPLSPAGRTFTIFLITSGVGTFAYAVSTLSRFLVEGEVGKIFEARRRAEAMRRLKDHVIVCGFGRVGEGICEELKAEKVPFVVIEKDPARIEEAEAKGFLFLYKDSTDEDVLKRAGIERAKALIAALGSDADNLFITLSAKELNPNIRVIARLNNPMNESKFYKAGADKVISPSLIGATKLAQAAVRPTAAGLVELAMTKKDLNFVLEEILVPENSKVAGKTLKELKIREETGAMIVAIVKSEREMKIPSPSDVIEPGDILIAFGNDESVRKVEKLICEIC